jgi:hypothetical protein
VERGRPARRADEPAASRKARRRARPRWPTRRARPGSRTSTSSRRRWTRGRRTC